MNIDFDGQPLELLQYDDKEHLKQLAPDVYARVRESVFWESDPRMAKTMAGFSGTVVRGDIRFAHPEDAGMSSFERIFEALGEIGYWLIFDGNLKMERSMAVDDETKVVVLGDLDTIGLSNICGQLIVEGKTRVEGTLVFDSNDGGFTKLDLAEPAGLIVTSANVFMVNLQSKYFYDPSFRCGFGSEPTTPHEERILGAFENEPTVITTEQLAAFFRPLSEEAADEVLAGDYETWIDEMVVLHDSRKLAQHFDDALS